MTNSPPATRDPAFSPPGDNARRSLHVLTLTPFYPHQQDDSAGRFVSEPLEALRASGLTTTVFAVRPFYRDAGVHARVTRVPAIWLRYFSVPGGLGLPTAGALLFARIVSRIRELHRSHPIDLVHAHAPLPCGHAALLLHTELGLPFVVSVHGLDVFSTNQVHGRAGEWCRRISMRVYRSSRRVICVSEHVREQVLEGTGPSCRTSVVYNAVDPDFFCPPETDVLTTPSVLSVGNLIPIKQHDRLIRAFALIAGEFPDLNLDIIGHGPELAHLRTLSDRLNVSKRVRFLGRRSRTEVAAAMRQCTIFALPSRYEALGCVYLEAMSAGKAVIGCRGQGIAEVIRHGSNGFLVGPDNDRELALAIAMLLRDESRRRTLERAARDTILDRFTLSQQAETLMRIYGECVA